MSLLVIIVNIPVEVPNVDTVSLTNRNDLSIVSWIEDDGAERVSVTDESLEIVWNSFLSFIVPYLDHTVFSTSQHVS